MKFDCAILNPPYEHNLHLKILEQVIAKADKVVNISPVRWLQDPFAAYSKNSDYCKFEETISKKIETLDIIPAKDASKIFDASFTINLGIYVCGNGGYDYQHNDSLIYKIVQKTLENNWRPFSQSDFCRHGCIQQKPYVLNISGIGSVVDGARVVCKNYENQCRTELMSQERVILKAGNNQSGIHIEFDTEEERYNFWQCYSHPFMLWYISTWKNDVHVYNNKVPYFNDYTHPWDYEDFFNWFDLTGEERVRVMKEIVISEKNK